MKYAATLVALCTLGSAALAAEPDYKTIEMSIDVAKPAKEVWAKVGGDPATQRILVRAAKPFKIVGVDGATDGLTVELPTTTASLPVQVITLKFAPKEAGVTGRQLRVRTDFEGNSSAILSLELEATK